MTCARSLLVGLALAQSLLGACRPPPAEDRRPPSPPPRLPCLTATTRDAAGSGCLFHWPAPDGPAPGLLFVAAPADHGVQFRLQARAASGWQTIDQRSLDAAGAAALVVAPGPAPTLAPAGVYLTEARTGGGLRLLASAPVVATWLDPDPRDGDSTRGGATLLLPSASAGRATRVVTWPHDASGAAWVTVVATADGARGMVEGVDGAVPFALSEGDTFTVSTTRPGQELAGARVRGEAPVLVFAGHTCAAPDGPVEPGGAVACDRLLEAMPAEGLLGRTTVVPPLPPRTEICATRAGWPFLPRVRFVATADDTRVTLDLPTGAPTALPDVFPLGRAGDVVEFEVSTPFLATASRPVLVAALVRCAPALVLLPSVERWPQAPTLLATGVIRETATLLRRAGSPVTLDGQPVDEALFGPAGGGFETAALVLPGCGLGRFGRAAVPGACVHHLGGSSVWALVAAQDFARGHAAGATFRVQLDSPTRSRDYPAP